MNDWQPADWTRVPPVSERDRHLFELLGASVASQDPDLWAWRCEYVTRNKSFEESLRDAYADVDGMADVVHPLLRLDDSVTWAGFYRERRRGRFVRIEDLSNARRSYWHIG